MKAAAAIAAIVLLVLGCATARRREPLAQGPVLDAVGLRGQKAYAMHCDACHPGGEGGLAPALNNKKLPDFYKRFQVRHGLGAMPSFSEDQISKDDLDAILRYLDALRDAR